MILSRRWNLGLHVVDECRQELLLVCAMFYLFGMAVDTMSRLSIN